MNKDRGSDIYEVIEQWVAGEDSTATELVNELRDGYSFGDKLAAIAMLNDNAHEDILDAIEDSFHEYILQEGRMLSRNGWEFLCRLAPDGHKLFTHNDAVGRGGCTIAIADNSGGTPDETDDGVLWVDVRRPIIVCLEDQVVVSIPVMDSRGVCSHTPTSLKGARTLREAIPAMKVSFQNEDLKALLE